MSRAAALLAAFAFAALYGAFSRTQMRGEELLGVSLGSAVVVLVVGAFADYLALRRDVLERSRAFGWLVARNLTFFIATAAAVAGLSVLVAGTYDTSGGTLAAQFVAVAVLSGGVAYGELISRYRDTPDRLLAAGPTASYICVNIAAGVAALMLVKEFAVVTAPAHRMVYEALLAGFGAIAFFRTSLFTVRVSGTDVGVGPSTLLKALLDSSDMLLNRWQGINRGADVGGIMHNVDFDRAKSALPALCFSLMQEFPPQQQATAAEQIGKLALDGSMDKAAKAKILGVYMIQNVGSDVLQRAVDTLGDSITLPPPGPRAP